MATALEGGEGSVSRPGCSLPPGKTRYPLYRRLGAPTGTRSPDSPASSQSLYRLRYLAHEITHSVILTEFCAQFIDECFGDSTKQWRLVRQIAKRTVLLVGCLKLYTNNPHISDVSLLSRERFFIYLINKYISLSDICLTVHHWYK